MAKLADGESVRIARDVLCAGASGAKVCVPQDVHETERALARRGGRRPVLVGDDRTLLRAVAQLERQRQLPEVALGMVPVGSPAGLVLVRSLGVPMDVVTAARTVLRGTERPLDLLVDDAGGLVLGGVRIPTASVPPQRSRHATADRPTPQTGPPGPSGSSGSSGSDGANGPAGPESSDGQGRWGTARAGQDGREGHGGQEGHSPRADHGAHGGQDGHGGRGGRGGPGVLGGPLLRAFGGTGTPRGAGGAGRPGGPGAARDFPGPRPRDQRATLLGRARRAVTGGPSGARLTVEADGEVLTRPEHLVTDISLAPASPAEVGPAAARRTAEPCHPGCRGCPNCSPEQGSSSTDTPASGRPSPSPRPHREAPGCAAHPDGSRSPSEGATGEGAEGEDGGDGGDGPEGLADVAVWVARHGGPLLARARTVTVSGPEFRYRADAREAGPVTARTWTVRPGAWRLVLPDDAHGTG